jgi:hypothetical protein
LVGRERDLALGWEANGSSSDSGSEESRVGRDIAEEPEARVVDLDLVEEVDLRVVVEGLDLVVFLTAEDVDGRGGLNGFGGILGLEILP